VYVAGSAGAMPDDVVRALCLVAQVRICRELCV